MLSRLETTYLGILRIIILVVATVALFAALVAFGSAVPALMRQIGLTHVTPTTGGTLADYIAERKATAPIDGSGSGQAPISNSKRNVDPNVSATAKNIFDYLSATSGGKELVIVPKLEDAIMTQSADVPPTDKADYYLDARRLSDQLKLSKGKRLTVDQVGDLFQWHERKFVIDLTAKSAKNASDVGASFMKLYIAGYSFAAFISVVFIFIFVKIERNLRLIRMTRVEADHA